MTPVDAHLHFWDRGLFRYDWLDDLPGAPISATPEMLARERVVLRAGVFVQADCLPEQGAAEALWASKLTGEDDGLAAVIAFAALEGGSAVADDLDALAEIPLVAGVRRLLQDEPDDLLLSPELQAGLVLVGMRGLVFDACVRDHQLSTLIRLRRGAPETRFVVDHLGKPPLGDGIASAAGVAWETDIRVLAREPDTYVKLSGLRPEADPGRPLKEQAAPFLSVALDAFGAERAMVGSDWPVSTTGCYDDWFDLLVDVLKPTPREWACLSEGTATAAYNLVSR